MISANEQPDDMHCAEALQLDLTLFDRHSAAGRALSLLYGDKCSAKQLGDGYSKRNLEAFRARQLRHVVQPSSDEQNEGAALRL